MKQQLTEDQIEFLGPHADGFLQYLEEQRNPQNEELDTTLEALGFTGEGLDKAKQLFLEMVENKASPANWPLRAGLAELLQIYWPLVEGSDVIGIALERIEELEEAVAEAEAERDRLVADHLEHLSESYSLDESTVTKLWDTSDSVDELHARLQAASKPERPARRSFVGDQLEGGVSYSVDGTTNEDSSFVEPEGYVGDPQMRKYLSYLK
jgi:hypothetical protein